MNLQQNQYKIKNRLSRKIKKCLSQKISNLKNSKEPRSFADDPAFPVDAPEAKFAGIQTPAGGEMNA